MLIITIKNLRRKLLCAAVCLCVALAMWFGLPYVYGMAAKGDYRSLDEPTRAEALPDTETRAVWFDLLLQE